jgi:hypothetical protein
MLSVLVHGLVTNAAWALIIREDDVLGVLEYDVLGVLIPVEGVVFNLDGPCREHVHIDGMAQVVVDTRQNDGLAEMAMYIVPLTVQGVGATTGARYLVTGAIQLNIVVEALPTHVTFVAPFALTPLGPCKLPPRTTAELEIQLDVTLDRGDDQATSVLAAIAVPNFIAYRNK